MTTTDLLDLALQSRWDSKTQPNSKTWRASSMGWCQRGSYLERLGIPKTRVTPTKEIRTMEWGNAVHDFCKGLLRETGCLIEPETPMNLCPGCRDDEWHVEDKDLNASAHLDCLLSSPALVKDGDSRLAHLRYQVMAGDSGALQEKARVVELKGLKSSAMIRMVREAKTKGPEHLMAEHHLMQVGTQALICKRNPSLLPLEPEVFEIVCAGKDAWGYLSYELTQKWIDKAEDWISTLNKAWEAGSLPNCQCSGWKSRFCSYPGEGGCCSASLANAA